MRTWTSCTRVVECCVRPLTLLLVVTVVWTVVDVAPHRRIAAAADATPRNFRQLFIGRCEEYQHVVFTHFIGQYVIIITIHAQWRIYM